MELDSLISLFRGRVPRFGTHARGPGRRGGRGLAASRPRATRAHAGSAGLSLRAQRARLLLGSGTAFPPHLIKLTMCCYLHADLPGFLSSCSRALVFLCVVIAQRSLNAIFVRPRCALIEDAFVPSNFFFL